MKGVGVAAHMAEAVCVERRCAGCHVKCVTPCCGLVSRAHASVLGVCGLCVEVQIVPGVCQWLLFLLLLLFLFLADGRKNSWPTVVCCCDVLTLAE